jgi:hypothetical protein
MKAGAVVALLLASVGAYADDPTSLLLQQRGQLPRYPGYLPRVSDVGPCYRGTHSVAFPNRQGFRCVRNY